MPQDGEARKRATLYKNEVMDPLAQSWHENAVPREEIIPNSKNAPEESKFDDYV